MFAINLASIEWRCWQLKLGRFVLELDEDKEGERLLLLLLFRMLLLLLLLLLWFKC